MRVLGIDPSLTRTAVADITVKPGKPASWTVHSLPTKGARDDTLTQRRDRLVRISDWVWETITEPPGITPDEYVRPDLILIEAPALNQTSGSRHDRSGLWWLIVERFIFRPEYRHHGDVPAVIEVTPQSLKKYATGKGNAGKDEVMLAAARRYAGSPEMFDNNDECDAFILACMGARHLGAPQEDSLPKAHLAAMDAVAWP